MTTAALILFEQHFDFVSTDEYKRQFFPKKTRFTLTSIHILRESIDLRCKLLLCAYYSSCASVCSLLGSSEKTRKFSEN